MNTLEWFFGAHWTCPLAIYPLATRACGIGARRPLPLHEPLLRAIFRKTGRSFPRRRVVAARRAAWRLSARVLDEPAIGLYSPAAASVRRAASAAPAARRPRAPATPEPRASRLERLEPRMQARAPRGREGARARASAQACAHAGAHACTRARGTDDAPTSVAEFYGVGKSTDVSGSASAF